MSLSLPIIAYQKWINLFYKSWFFRHLHFYVFHNNYYLQFIYLPNDEKKEILESHQIVILQWNL